VTDEIHQPDPETASAAAGPDPASVAAPAAAPIAAPVAASAAADPGAIYTAPDRPRGLDAYFAPGGEDEATDERRADERRNLRLLFLMVAALVLIPTLLTIAALAQELVTRRGG
jgi:hypothetical protein